MKFINKWYLIIWVILLIVSFFFGFLYSSVCWDGIKIDQEILMQKCNVTIQEYQEQMKTNTSFCPEGRQAYTAVGGCRPRWPTILVLVIFTSVIYNIIYAIVYFINKRK